MSYIIEASIYATRTDPSENREEITLSIQAGLSDAEARYFEPLDLGDSFALPPHLLDNIKKVNAQPANDTSESYSELTLDRIAMITIQNPNTHTELVRFLVQGASRGETGPANHWRAMSVADEEKVTVADWKRNNGKGIFVMSTNVLDIESDFEGTAPEDVVLTPKDRVVRLIGDSFCIFNPANGAPSNGRERQPRPHKLG